MDDLLAKHRTNGILIDSNILILALIGTYDPQLISRFKRTEKFSVRDFRTLEAILSGFRRVVTTPSILTEVSNLCGQIGDPIKTSFFSAMSRSFLTMDERYVAARDLAAMDGFAKFGLTDMGIAVAAENGVLILTDDFRLSHYLSSLGRDVINFSHLL